MYNQRLPSYSGKTEKTACVLLLARANADRVVSGLFQVSFVVVNCKVFFFILRDREILKMQIKYSEVWSRHLLEWLDEIVFCSQRKRWDVVCSTYSETSL